MQIKEYEALQIERWKREFKSRKNQALYYGGLTLAYAGIITSNVMKNWHYVFEYVIVMYMLWFTLRQVAKLRHYQIRLKFTDIWNGEVVGNDKSRQRRVQSK